MTTFFEVRRTFDPTLLEAEPVPRGSDVTLWSSETETVSSWPHKGTATIYAQLDPKMTKRRRFWATTQVIDLAAFGFKPTRLARAQTFDEVRKQLPEIVECDHNGRLYSGAEKHPAIEAYCGYPVRYWDLELFETAHDRVFVVEYAKDITLFDVRTPDVKGYYFFAYPRKLDMLDFGFTHIGTD